MTAMEGVILVRPVEVARGGFAFCRWSMAAALWAALLLGQPWLVALTGAILGASALLGVERSPMIVLWRLTGHRLLPTAEVVLDGRAMRFAHSLGALLCGASFVLLLTSPAVGRGALFFLSVLKTAGGFGFCTASRLWACAARGGCCALARRRHG